MRCWSAGWRSRFTGGQDSRHYVTGTLLFRALSWFPRADYLLLRVTHAGWHGESDVLLCLVRLGGCLEQVQEEEPF